MITIELPDALCRLTGVERTLTVDADDLKTALATLVERHPILRVHLFDESGGFREHVLCFHNDRNTRWLDDGPLRLAPGDRIMIMQAVSGG